MQEVAFVMGFLLSDLREVVFKPLIVSIKLSQLMSLCHFSPSVPVGLDV